MIKFSDIEIKRKGDRLYVVYPGMAMGMATITDGSRTIDHVLDSIRTIYNIKKLSKSINIKNLGPEVDPRLVELLLELEDL